MKRSFVAITLIALFFSMALTGCEKEEILVKTKESSFDKIPSYDKVIKDMEESGCCKIMDETITSIIEKKLSPDYTQYSIYYNKSEKTYFVVTQYDSNDVKALAGATGECKHKYTETKDRNGNKYISCGGEGNTCSLEIQVLPGGEKILVFIVTC